MSTRPLAIITVIRNDFAGFLATRTSLRSQSRQDFDWIVVDGGSTDGTAEWLADHTVEATWWRSGPDRGPYHAMNLGLAATTAPVVLFLNAGDCLAGPQVVERLLAALGTHHEADVLYGDALERLADGQVVLKPARDHKAVAFGMFTHHPAILYRIPQLGSPRYDERFTVGADYAFTLRALAAARSVVRLQDPVCLVEPAGLSARDAATGRRDQARIRYEILGYGRLRNGTIAALQRVSMEVRRRLPETYKRLRFISRERICLFEMYDPRNATKC